MDVLVEFRAGKMQLVDTQLRADNRKGLLRVAQDEHGMNHVQWLERNAGDPETDVIVFPGEASFSKIGRPGARVFQLKFKDEPDRDLFFWAQEPEAAQDDDYCGAVNNILNLGLEDMEAEGPAHEQPPAAPAQPAQQPAAAVAAGGDLGGNGAGGAIQADLLASVLSNIMTGGAAVAQQRQQQVVEVGPSLGEVLKPELLVPLLQAPDIMERLAPFLPEQQRSREALADIVASPQFRHQLSLFSHALMSGQLDLSQFGLQGQGFGVLEFLAAIQRQADAEKQQRAQEQQQMGGGAQPEAPAEGQ